MEGVGAGIVIGVIATAGLVVAWECIKPKLKEYLNRDSKRVSQAYVRGMRDAKRAGDTRLDGIEDALEIIRAEYGKRVIIKDRRSKK